MHNNLKEGRFPSLGSWSDNQRRQRRSLYLSGAQNSLVKKIRTIAYTLKTKPFQEWDKESSFGCSQVWCFSFGWKVGRDFYPEWRESFESGFHLLALDNISTACTQAPPQLDFYLLANKIIKTCEKAEMWHFLHHHRKTVTPSLPQWQRQKTENCNRVSDDLVQVYILHGIGEKGREKTNKWSWIVQGGWGDP